MYKFFRFLFIVLATIIVLRQLPEGKQFIDATFQLFKAMVQEATKLSNQTNFSPSDDPKQQHFNKQSDPRQTSSEQTPQLDTQQVSSKNHSTEPPQLVTHSGYTWVLTDDRDSPFQITQELYNVAHKIVQKKELTDKDLQQLQNPITVQDKKKKKLAWLNPKNWFRPKDERKKRKHWWQFWRPKKEKTQGNNPSQSSQQMADAAQASHQLSDTEKARRLFDWFEENITYGESKRKQVGYRHSLEVFKSKEGVCGEMAILYCVMARAVGLKSHYLRVRRDHKSEEVRHACAAVKLNGNWVQIDPAYNTYDIHHQKTWILSDSEAIADFKRWRE